MVNMFTAITHEMIADNHSLFRYHSDCLRVSNHEQISKILQFSFVKNSLKLDFIQQYRTDTDSAQYGASPGYWAVGGWDQFL